MKRALISSFMVALFVIFGNASLVVHAATVASQSVCNGISAVGGNCAASNGTSIDSTLAFVLNLLSAIAGFIGVIFVIIGGVKYVTSGGNSEKTNSAKDTILYAIIGLVVAALAQVIVKFVLNKASGL